MPTFCTTARTAWRKTNPRRTVRTSRRDRWATSVLLNVLLRCFSKVRSCRQKREMNSFAECFAGWFSTQQGLGPRRIQRARTIFIRQRRTGEVFIHSGNARKFSGCAFCVRSGSDLVKPAGKCSQPGTASKRTRRKPKSSRRSPPRSRVSRRTPKSYGDSHVHRYIPKPRC